MDILKRDIDVSLLRAFLSVIETGSMTKSAQQLSRTQAAVSMQIKRLEEVLDCKLFERKGKSLILTPTGERLILKARRMIRLNDEIWNAIAMPEFEGEVTLGVPNDIVSVFMPKILREFNNKWPQIRVKLMCEPTTALIEALETNKIQLTLTTEQIPSKNMLLASPLVWAGAKNGEAYLKEPLPITIGDERCAFRACAISALEGNDQEWTSVNHHAGMEAVEAAVEADLAIIPLMQHAIPHNLIALTDKDELPKLPIFYINMYVAEQHDNGAVTELAKTIQQGFAANKELAAA